MAEFNAITDPEAARICFEMLPCIEMVSWELTLASHLPWSFVDQHGFSSLSPASLPSSPSSSSLLSTKQFVSSLLYNYERMYRTDHGLVLCDVLAFVCWLHPSLITKTALQSATVETSGTHSRGAIVIDWYSKGLLKDCLSSSPQNLLHILAFDTTLFTQLFISYLSE